MEQNTIQILMFTESDKEKKMGYTNCWHQIEDFTDTEFMKLANHTRKMIKFFEEELEIKFSEVSFKELALKEDDLRYISFNGDIENDLDHETFVFTQIKREKYDYETDQDYENKGAFNFCKTNRKPYDALVWNVLRKAFEIAPEKITISNDDGKKHSFNYLKSHFAN